MAGASHEQLSRVKISSETETAVGAPKASLFPAVWCTALSLVMSRLDVHAQIMVAMCSTKQVPAGPK